MTGGSERWSSLLRALVAVLVRPHLWPTALRQARLLVPPGWWRRAPFLPLPDAHYLRFRLVTAYGDPEHPPPTRDVVTYLEWCREFDRWKPPAGLRGRG